MVKVGIIGASGYTGVELLRLIAGHPDLDLGVGDGRHQGRGRRRRRSPRRCRSPIPTSSWSRSTSIASPPLRSTSSSSASRTRRPRRSCPQLVDVVGCVVDLSAAFRLQRRRRRTRAGTGSSTISPNCCGGPSTACPERTRAELPGARLVATPGCYVTAATLALAPLLDGGLIERSGIIVDAASGVSGAGRALTRRNGVLHGRRELHRLRAARPPAHARDRAEPRRRGAVHAPPRADEPRDPGDLLRPPGRRRRAEHRRTARRAGQGLPRRAVRRRHRRRRRRRRRRWARTRRS